jgi:hypothetical protein
LISDFLVPFGLGALVVGVACYLLPGRIYRGLRRQQSVLQVRNEQDLNAYLEVLRREVGNWLMTHDPDALATAYDEIMEYERNVGESTKIAEITRLSEKYKYFTDFDIVSTRHFVPYDEAFCTHSNKKILENYLDISKWLIVTNNSSVSVTSEDERLLLDKMMQTQRNAKFREEVSRAMDRYFRSDHASYEDEQYRIWPLPATSPATDYAVELRSSNEFAIYERFFSDDGEKYTSIYRSDPSFGLRKPVL